MDASLHLGSLIAIMHYFFRDLIDFTNNKKILNLLVIGSLPLIIVGYFFYEYNIYEKLSKEFENKNYNLLAKEIEKKSNSNSYQPKLEIFENFRSKKN